MAYTFSKIATVTVGSGGVSSIDFLAIPQNYTDLLLKFSTQEATTGSWEFLVSFNGTSSNLSNRRLRGSGAAVASYNSTNILGATDPAGISVTFGNGELYIPNYAGSNYKSVSMDTVAENNFTEGYQILTAGLWSSTAAITSIKLQITPSGNWAQYSSATLYGIKAEV